VEINLLLLFMIAAAVIAVMVKDLLSSVIAVGAVGIGLSMAFLVMKAPDLAIMQLVVEILSLIILIRATVRKDLPFSRSGRWTFNTISTILFTAAFLAFAYFSFSGIHGFGSPLMRVSQEYLSQAQSRTGMQNVIAAITLNYRAVDTLGEAAALFTAVIGVLTVARKIWRREDAKYESR
jgi:multicomponent Na+:H+ antiporter subunit B